MRRPWIPVLCAAVVLGASVLSWWASTRARQTIEQVAALLLTNKRASPMSYSSIVVTSGSNSTTYTDVTGYTSHENYIAFTGKGPGDATAKSYEINRTAFDSVQKNPVE